MSPREGKGKEITPSMLAATRAGVHVNAYITPVKITSQPVFANVALERSD
ncbi:protein of unknown function [Cyanobium sp. NIES-981]|nr:protein of unknown function [Cyanobium sp. NIES-981]